jgi:hypothetical protein
MTTPQKVSIAPCDVRAMRFHDDTDVYGIYRSLNGTLVEAICQCDTQPMADEIARRVNAHEALLDELERSATLLRELHGRFENGAATKLLIHKRFRSIETTLEKFR